MKENIKTAIELAEQEVQEKEIASLKKIVKDLLESKLKKEEKKREIEKEISIIKQTIDDFKAGRLDKVKELIEKDSVAKETLPFKILIINQPVITQPWKWTYKIEPNYSYSTSSLTADSCNAGYYLTTSTGSTGTNYATFTSGTYKLSGKIINL